MRKIALALMISLVGCATTTYMPGVDPPKMDILKEVGLLGLASYAVSGDAVNAIEHMDEYLYLMYGTGPFGQSPKYSTAGLIHSLTVQNIPDLRMRRMVIAARIFLDKNGDLTGVDWLDALLMAERTTVPESEPLSSPQ